MVIRLRRVKQIAGRIGICGGALLGIRFAVMAVPILQSVEIGTVLQAETAESVQTEAAFPVGMESGVREMEVQFAAGDAEPAVQEADDNAENTVISWESDASKEMWQSKPYPDGRTSDDGKVVEQHFGKQSGMQFVDLEKAGQIRNCTFWNNADLKAESEILPTLDVKLDGTPMVLIYHTHTTESFEAQERSFYDASFNYRTTEPDKNMVMVGDAIAQALNDAGIGVVHAQEIHDFPVWNNSYARSADTVKAILEAYPSICIALDVHRDAIADTSTIYAPVAEINGKKSAQIMIIAGCDDGTMGMPHYQENFHFASLLQQTAEGMYAGFTRPILFDYRKYNQDLTTGSLLVEFGSQGNTMEEARYAGTLFGNALAETIHSIAQSGETEA